MHDDLLGSAAASPVTVNVPAVTGGEMALGAYDGANRYDEQLKLWQPVTMSADAEILPDKESADARSRDMVRNDAYVQGGVALHRDNIVGSQFVLNAKPSSRALLGTQDDVWETEFQEEVEELFDLAAESPDNLFDAAGMNTFTGLIRLAVGVHVFAGEVLATVEWVKDGRPFNTAIQMIDVDRLQTPPIHSMSRQIRGGVKRDMRGKPLSYFIRRSHPGDLMPAYPGYGAREYLEVEHSKPWGRRQVIHLLEQSRPDQTRGIGEMTAALKEMRVTKKFRDVTLQNAVVQALYAAAITSDLPSETVFAQMGGGQLSPEQVQKATENYAKGFMSTIAQFTGSAKNLHVDGVRIPHLMPGTKLEMISPGKGGPIGMDFERSLLRYIASALNVSYEQLSRDYTNTNYSSARAAMAETWKFMLARKKMIADRFATIIYRLWLEEMVNANALTTFPASRAGMLYTNDRLNMAWEALARCDWIGAARGQIDEKKETEAAILRMGANLTTLEEETSKMGGDWRKKLRQRARERALMERLGLNPDPQPAAAGAAPQEKREEESEDE